jgi:hypothetical protein
MARTSVMRHPVSDDKVIIKRGMDGHYVFFSVRDERDNGSIIDFVQFRQGISIGAVQERAEALDRSAADRRSRFSRAAQNRKRQDESGSGLCPHERRIGRASLSRT